MHFHLLRSTLYHLYVSRLLWEMNSAFKKKRLLQTTLPPALEGLIERTLSELPGTDLNSPRRRLISAGKTIEKLTKKMEMLVLLTLLSSSKTPVYHRYPTQKTRNCTLKSFMSFNQPAMINPPYDPSPSCALPSPPCGPPSACARSFPCAS